MRKTAYVTGADRGLGLALTSNLLSRGFKVYAGSYMPDWYELQQLKQARSAEDLQIVQLDVTDATSVKAAARLISEDTSHLNLVVNNAGIATEVDRASTILDDEHDADIQRILNTNALGPMRVTQSVLSLLLNGSPRTLVNISSVASSISGVTRANQYGYCMSKVALNMQSKLIHNHLKELGVKVMVFHPGWMPSYIFGDPQKMQGAPVHMTQSAQGILDQVDREQAKVNEFTFTDYMGNAIDW